MSDFSLKCPCCGQNLVLTVGGDEKSSEKHKLNPKEIKNEDLVQSVLRLKLEASQNVFLG